MDRIKEQIKELFCKELDKLSLQDDSKSTIEFKLNSIIENCLERVDLTPVSVPLKQTSNDNILDGINMSEKSSDVDLCSNSYYQAKHQDIVIQETIIPANFSLNDELRNYATKNFIPKQFVDLVFEDFKLYYQSKAILNSDWEAVWKRWVLKNNKYKNHLIKTTIDENMELSKDMREFAVQHIDQNNIDLEFMKFKNHYLANGDLKISWIKVWENWCIKHKQFKPKELSKQAQEKTNYKWDFKKAKDTSDRIKDWLEFEKGINWLDDFYWKGIPIPGIGWQKVQHPDFNKEEILLYKIDSENGNFMLQYKTDDIIDAEILEND